MSTEPFVAIDFETADTLRDSACAVGLVRVEGDRITARETRLIRPPRKGFEFTHIHGITWAQVAAEPAFIEVWDAVQPILDGVTFLAAHNAPFDRSVLDACLTAAGRPPEPRPFVCTVRLARRVLGCSPANLPAVCRHLGISLKHHDAASDAEACARIVIAARAHDGAQGGAFEEAALGRASSASGERASAAGDRALSGSVRGATPAAARTGRVAGGRRFPWPRRKLG